MKPLAVLIAFLLLSTLAVAQKTSGSVRGTLQDGAGTPLEDATVSVMTAKDSSLLSFTLTSSSGFFEVKNIAAGEYYLLVSYQGFEPLKKAFSITADKSAVDLQTIKMEKAYKTLGEVVVTDMVPIKVKGDTLAFNADAFKTKPNATVEDLLKKLPGMQVERDGTVKAQGENVQKVYVDGKEFFGNDPKLATKNLTADMISEVEVYDDMSEQAKFNGIDDGSRSKAINLKLKKDKKKGTFGRAYAGYGTEDRYDAGVMANFFKGASRVSLIAKANNVNNIGFSVTDNIGMFSGGGGGMMMGGGRGMMMLPGGGGGTFGSGSGITRTAQAGINYRDTWSEKFDASGSYFFNNANAENLRRSNRQTFFGDSTINRDQQSWSQNRNNNHRVNFHLTYAIDSFNTLIYQPNLSFQNSSSLRDDTLSQYTQKGGTAYLLNHTRTINDNTGAGTNWTNNLTWRHKTRKLGRTLAVTFTNTYNQSDRESFVTSRGNSYNEGGIKIRDNSFRQQNGQASLTANYGISASYTEPLARDKILEFNYAYTRNFSESERKTWDYNALTGKYDTFNDSLSNTFQNLNEQNRLGTNFRVIKKKYNYQLGVAVQKTGLKSDNISKDKLVEQTYTNFFPTANFNYNFARSRSLRLNYRGRTSQPSITQLQDLIDPNTAPYYRTGNPGLDQEFSNNLSLAYNFFDVVKFRNLFVMLNFSNTYDKIVDHVLTRNFPAQYKSYETPGAQLTIPVNMDGVYSVTGAFNFGFPIKRMKGGNINTNTRLTRSRNGSMLDGVKSYTNNLTLGEDLRLNYNYKERLDLGITASLNYTQARYTIQKDRNTTYFSHNYSGDATYSFPKGLILSTDFDYIINPEQGEGVDRDFALWNASVAQELFKSKRGEVKLSVYDILNQNRSFTRTVGEGYVEDVQSTVLNRFFMLTFSYKLNRMGGKSIAPRMDRNMRF